MNEKLAISKSSPLKARNFDYKHFTYPWHFHSEYEIIYISDSTGVAFIGNNVEKYIPGDILLLGSNLAHYLKSDDIYHSTACNLSVKGSIIQFEKEFMQHAVDHYPQFNRIKNLLNECKLGILFPAKSSSKLAELIIKIPTYKGLDQITSFLQLLNEMSLNNNKKIVSTPELTFDIQHVSLRIDKVLAYLNKNYTRQIELDEIATIASMNSTAFCRYFKKETGKSFKKFIFDLRIGYACKLLLINKLSVAQISSECGFETISHFNKVFKKSMSYSPTEYKKLMAAIE